MGYYCLHCNKKKSLYCDPIKLHRLSRFTSIKNRSEYELEKSSYWRTDQLSQGEMDTGYKKLSYQHIFQLQFLSGKFYGSKMPVLQSTRTKNNLKTLNLLLYKQKTKMSMAKKEYLLSLCKSGVSPLMYHAYYENRPVGKSVKGTLLEPDVTEEE